MSLLRLFPKKIYQSQKKYFLYRKNEGTLLDLDSGLKQPQAPAKLSETEHPPEFDQILDLNNHQESTTGGAPLAPATPLIAFEDSITTSPKQEVPTAGKQKCRFRT